MKSLAISVETYFKILFFCSMREETYSVLPLVNNHIVLEPFVSSYFIRTWVS